MDNNASGRCGIATVIRQHQLLIESEAAMSSTRCRKQTSISGRTFQTPRAQAGDPTLRTRRSPPRATGETQMLA